jgi:metabotropic X receptor
MHQDLCDGKPGLCEAMRPTKGSELLKYLRNVKFMGLTGDEFNFDRNGDGPARYNIIHFKQVETGKYQVRLHLCVVKTWYLILFIHIVDKNRRI